ncbi:MAG: 50S ribosomal protein L10 [Candidatus Delongbacteria bacterium]|nr:50S ribosomal protein L10 [Candidatus Delongbacteria bacterium]
MPTPQKETLVAAIRENIDKAESIYLTDFTGVSVNQMEEMRHKLSEVDAEYKVVKNTLLRIALAETPYADMGEGLTGQTGIAFGYGDPAAPARVLRDMIKVINKNHVKLIAYEQQIHQADFLNRLADLPTREVQLQILLATMLAPISAFARVVNAIKEKMEAEGGDTAVPAEGATPAAEAAPVESDAPEVESPPETEPPVATVSEPEVKDPTSAEAPAVAEEPATDTTPVEEAPAPAEDTDAEEDTPEEK